MKVKELKGILATGNITVKVNFDDCDFEVSEYSAIDMDKFFDENSEAEINEITPEENGFFIECTIHMGLANRIYDYLYDMASFQDELMPTPEEIEQEMHTKEGCLYQIEALKAFEDETAAGLIEEIETYIRDIF